jgi:hypothetical protein
MTAQQNKPETIVFIRLCSFFCPNGCKEAHKRIQLNGGFWAPE